MMDFEFENELIQECGILLKRITTEFKKMDTELERMETEAKTEKSVSVNRKMWDEIDDFERKTFNQIKRDYLDTLAELEREFGALDDHAYLIIHRARMAVDFDINTLAYDSDTHEVDAEIIGRLIPYTLYQWMVQNIHNIQSEIASQYICETNSKL